MHSPNPLRPPGPAIPVPTADPHVAVAGAPLRTANVRGGRDRTRARRGVIPTYTAAEGARGEGRRQGSMKPGQHRHPLRARSQASATSLTWKCIPHSTPRSRGTSARARERTTRHRRDVSVAARSPVPLPGNRMSHCALRASSPANLPPPARFSGKTRALPIATFFAPVDVMRRTSTARTSETRETSGPRKSKNKALHIIRRGMKKVELAHESSTCRGHHHSISFTSLLFPLGLSTPPATRPRDSPIAAAIISLDSISALFSIFYPRSSACLPSYFKSLHFVLRE